MLGSTLPDSTKEMYERRDGQTEGMVGVTALQAVGFSACYFCNLQLPWFVAHLKIGIDTKIFPIIAQSYFLNWIFFQASLVQIPTHDFKGGLFKILMKEKVK